MCSVSFLVATYRRADALAATLGSLRLQTRADWEAVVVGDACGPETADAVRAAGDPRIRYYNLPARCGEQSGPSNAGLLVARGTHVAFLNHDDLLLPDHAERALAARADVYMGRFAEAVEFGPDGAPAFTRERPYEENLSHLLVRDPWRFDPGSFNVVAAAYARAVGPWRAARSLHRPPLRDWLLRAWRRGGTFRFGDAVTGLRLLTHNKRTGAPLYEHASPEHARLLERLARETPDATRAWLAAQRRPPASRRARRLRWLWRWRRNLWKHAFLTCGIDREVLRARLARRRPGALLDELSIRRTGAGLADGDPVAAFEEDPERYRVR